MNSNNDIQMLRERMDQAANTLSIYLDTNGMNLITLGGAVSQFQRSGIGLPADAACRQGCAFCCHLRVGVSIPEVLLVYSELKTQTTPEGLEYFKQKIMAVCSNGQPLSEAWWRNTQTACPFLDPKGNCLIYGVRPFSCRAYHSLDVEDCQKGFDLKQEIKIPCFPMFRAFHDMYATVLTKVTDQKGLPSYQVGFIPALGLLFEDDSRIGKWLNGNDVFRSVGL